MLTDFLIASLKIAASMANKMAIFTFVFASITLFFILFGDKVFPSLTSGFRDIYRLAAPYFNTQDRGEFTLLGKKFMMKEKTFAWGMIITLIIINTFQVEVSVLFNDWGRRFYNAIQQKDGAVFWVEIAFFSYLAFILIVTAVIEYYFIQLIIMRWRQWMTGASFTNWLKSHAHYRMALFGNVDNPDQRISEDIRKFTDVTINLFIRFYTALLSLYTFIIILWGLSASFNYKIGSYDLANIPGYLVWAAALYALFGTIFTHLIGRRLIKLDYKREQTEADFRFSLARLRENGEPIALLKGEKAEQQSLSGKFSKLMGVWVDVVRVNIQMTWFTSFFGQFSIIFPYLLFGPAYFATGSTLGFGDLQKTSSAFGRVEGALTIFINMYATLADYRAVINRLTSFYAAIDTANSNEGDFKRDKNDSIAVKNLKVQLPNGRVLVQAENLTFAKGVDTLVTGPSGSGKSTIFRAIAGLWPYGSGEITTPENMLLIPQKPYLPLGTLRNALCYPSDTKHDDETLMNALTIVKLEHLISELDVEKPWHLTLSGGEQQRLSLARAVLMKPDWLFLDEATAAMDEPTEALLYTGLKKALPNTTIISIGHRSTLVNFHEKRVNLSKNGDHFEANDSPLMLMKA